MSYEELLNKGLIKRFKPSPSQVKNRIELAKRDIKAARLMMASDFGLPSEHFRSHNVFQASRARAYYRT